MRTIESRKELLKEWRDNPQKMVKEAKDEGMDLASYLDDVCPQTEEHKVSTSENILKNLGIRIEEETNIPSTPLKDCFKVLNEKSEVDLTAEEKLFESVLYNKFKRAMVTGVTTRQRKKAERESQKLQLAGTIPVQSVRKPYRDEAPFNATPRVAAWTVDDILATSAITLPSGEGRINKRTNVITELQFQRLTEASRRKRIRLADESEPLDTDSFGIAIEYTDQFLNNNLYSAADLANAYEEIGVVYSIDVRREGIRAILTADDLPDENLTGGDGQTDTTHVSGVITFNEWNRFIKGFGDIWQPDTVIGSANAIAAFEAMSAGHNYNIIARNSAGVPTGTSLNQNPLDVRRGFLNLSASGDKAALSQLSDTKLLVFDSNYVLYMYFTAGVDQDEMQRDADERITARLMTTDYGFITKYIQTNNSAAKIASF